MRRDYDEEPYIPPFTSVEEGIKQYWDASRAWKGFPTNQTWSIGRLFEVLHPLKTQVKSHKLSSQATDLSELIVKNRTKRPSSTMGELVVLPCKTNNFDPQVKVA